VAHFEVWQRFKWWCSDHDQDICHTTLELIENWMKSVEGIPSKTTIAAPGQIINLQQQITNNNYYQVQKPRREPYSLDCVKPKFRRTFTSGLFEAYVLHKAGRIRMEFSYRDFFELEHSSFRRIVTRLKRKGLVVANPLRTNPRFYILAEQLRHGGPE